MLRWIPKKIFHALGWRVVGEYPYHLPKAVVIVAPHTSAWDVPVGLLVKFWLDLRLAFYVKREYFKGVAGWILPHVGALPLDRSGNNNLVAQVVNDFNTLAEHTILLTPEGTRKKSNSFKTGFYHIAHQADVPVVPIYFDFEHKKVGMLNHFHVTGDIDKELPAIEDLFRGIKGYTSENSLDMRDN